MREKFRSSVTRWHCSMIRSLPGYSFREAMMKAEFKIQKRQKSKHLKINFKKMFNQSVNFVNYNT